MWEAYLVASTTHTEWDIKEEKKRDRKRERLVGKKTENQRPLSQITCPFNIRRKVKERGGVDEKGKWYQLTDWWQQARDNNPGTYTRIRRKKGQER